MLNFSKNFDRNNLQFVWQKQAGKASQLFQVYTYVYRIFHCFKIKSKTNFSWPDEKYVLTHSELSRDAIYRPIWNFSPAHKNAGSALKLPPLWRNYSSETYRGWTREIRVNFCDTRRTATRVLRFSRVTSIVCMYIYFIFIRSSKSVSY